MWLKVNPSILVMIFLIFLCLFNNISKAATITAAGDGNWNSTTEDAPWPGGTVPATTDDIITDNHSITVTANATCASIDVKPAAGGGSPTFTVNTGITFTVTGNVQQSANNGGSSATLTLNGTAVLKVGGNFTNHADATFTAATGSIVEFNSSTANQSLNSGGDAFGELKINNTFSNGEVDLLTNAITINGKLTISNGTLDDNGLQITGNADNTFTMAASTGLILGSAATATTYPTAFTAANITINASATIKYNSDAAQTISGVDPYGDLNLVATAAVTKTLGAAIDVNGDLTIGANNTLDVDNTSNYKINVVGHFTNNGTYTQRAGTVEFDGGANQDILGSSTTTFHDLKINNSSGDVDVTVNTSVDGTLTLTAGDIVVASGKLLTIEDVDDPGFSGGSTSTMIVGPVKKKYTSTTAITIPVGNGTKYLPVQIAPNDANATHWLVEYKSSAHATATACSDGSTSLKYISDTEHHIVDRTSGTTDATIRLYWDASSDVEEANISSLRIGHYNSGSDCWENANTTVSTNTTDDWIEAAITSFSPFSFASVTSGEHFGLPIKLIDFSAVTDGQIVRLKWSTATEINNEYFTIERSEDGLHFETIHLIEGAGSSNKKIDYTVVDEDPIQGISYYRLKQTDFDGQYEYFPVVSVNFNHTVFDLADIYPNPAMD
ncbi:MAG: hypothetical protein JKY33_01745, partial [Bacteroidia bacterium]|nr:hypothetical protein [Bacteroidia bacterium]